MEKFNIFLQFTELQQLEDRSLNQYVTWLCVLTIKVLGRQLRAVALFVLQYLMRMWDTMPMPAVSVWIVIVKF